MESHCGLVPDTYLRKLNKILPRSPALTTDLSPRNSLARTVWAGACLALLAALLVWRLAPEWQLNPQYRYGFLVPLLVAFLAWRARQTMPVAAPRDGWGIRLGMGGVWIALAAIDVVAASNPDWRLAMWIYGLLVFVGVWLWLDWAGGWGAWFAGATGLLFFAIPWPTAIEQSAVQGLMRLVALVSGEVCNLVGVPVESRGNVLRLNSGEWVGVEDACSGVRSLQSSLMAAYFLGRWMCLSWRRGLLLFGIAALLSFLFNLGRATGLTLLAHFKGGGAVQRWHDFAGNSVAVLVFLVLLAIALRMEREPVRPQREARAGGATWVPVVGAMSLACIPVMTSMWFAADRNRAGADRLAQVQVDWRAVPGRVRYEAIPGRARELLRYSEGRHGWWEETDGVRLDLFEFGWEAGRVSSFGEIHRPDVCLPASGFELAGHDEAWRVIEIGGENLVVERFEFEDRPAVLYVYFCAWDLGADGGAEAVVTGARERLANAWHGRRVDGRRVVQVLVSGAASSAQADLEVAGLLARVLE